MKRLNKSPSRFKIPIEKMGKRLEQCFTKERERERDGHEDMKRCLLVVRKIEKQYMTHKSASNRWTVIVLSRILTNKKICCWWERKLV